MVKINAKFKLHAGSHINTLPYARGSKVGFTPKGQFSGPNQRADDTSAQFFTPSGLCLQELNSNGPEIAKKKRSLTPNVIWWLVPQFSHHCSPLLVVSSGVVLFTVLGQCGQPACAEQVRGAVERQMHQQELVWDISMHSTEGSLSHTVAMGNGSLFGNRMQIHLRFLWLIESVV